MVAEEQGLVHYDGRGYLDGQFLYFLRVQSMLRTMIKVVDLLRVL